VQPNASKDPFLGQVVDGRFHIEALLGVGTVGSVYRARDRQRAGTHVPSATACDTVALKIWNATAHDAQTRGRFVREAKALSTLRHPNIVDIRSYGMVEDTPYVVMEYLDGQPLERLVEAQQPLDPELAFSVITQVLTALCYAHALGVVHRDLKPDNVVLVNTASGERLVKLLDYGLAKFLSSEDDPLSGSILTITGMIMGTPLYMAPEQVAGKPVDARVDVYAAGCMLFEMLTGRPPFCGDSHADIYRAHLEAEIPQLPAQLRGCVRGGDLQAFIEKALAKRPEQRFAHAGDMLEALSGLLRAPSVLERVGVLPWGGESRLRRGGVAVLVACVCVVAGLAYAVFR